MDGGEDVIPAPTIPRSQDRKDVVLALKDIFMLEDHLWNVFVEII